MAKHNQNLENNSNTTLNRCSNNLYPSTQSIRVEFERQLKGKCFWKTLLQGGANLAAANLAAKREKKLI